MITKDEVDGRVIESVMNRDVVTINAAGSIHEAIVLMDENRVSTLPVVDNADRCVGILSSSDLVDMTRDVDDDVYELDHADIAGQRYLVEKLIHSMGSESIQSFMSEKVSTAKSNESIVDAAKRMIHDEVHHLPVVDQDMALVGIVSTMDLLAAFVDAANS